jgi:hypothetical protein
MENDKDPTGQFECIASTFDNMYAIRNNATDELRIMRCEFLNMETFCEADWEDMMVVA